MQDQKKQNMLITALTSVALVALIVAYFAPIWWVSLTAPNYPKDAFPDGIRIHFHFNGVFNGCTAVGKGTRMGNETLQADVGEDTPRYNPILDKDKDVNKEAKSLDCVHEMNTINHYVGMFPIATGAPVEKPLAKFFFGFFTVMLAGFVVRQRKLRLAVLAGGFVAVAAPEQVVQRLVAVGAAPDRVGEIRLAEGAHGGEVIVVVVLDDQDQLGLVRCHYFSSLNVK